MIKKDSLNSHFFETIRVKDGELLHMKYHQKRVNSTREFFGFKEELEFEESIFNLPTKGEFRLRVDYAEVIISSTCREFTCREFRDFKIVESDIEYAHKYANRDELDALMVDEKEIIIAKDGLLRDTTIANIALHVDGVWMTPKNPLLRGTTRARLMRSGFLKSKNLTIRDLEKAENFAIMNALIDFKIVKKARIELGFKRTIHK
jgi:4-amino-4-deoxychorismate lyase